jgi:aspartyl-tRNA synthetase
MLMVLAKEQNLRDTVAFPKNQTGADPMTGAPSDADPAHLRELGIGLLEPPSQS